MGIVFFSSFRYVFYLVIQMGYELSWGIVRVAQKTSYFLTQFFAGSEHTCCRGLRSVPHLPEERVPSTDGTRLVRGNNTWESNISELDTSWWKKMKILASCISVDYIVRHSLTPCFSLKNGPFLALFGVTLRGWQLPSRLKMFTCIVASRNTCRNIRHYIPRCHQMAENQCYMLHSDWKRGGRQVAGESRTPCEVP